MEAKKKNVQLTTNAATVGKTATSLITKQLIKRQQKWKEKKEGKKKIFHSLIYLHQVAQKETECNENEKKRKILCKYGL